MTLSAEDQALIARVAAEASSWDEETAARIVRTHMMLMEDAVTRRSRLTVELAAAERTIMLRRAMIDAVSEARS